MKKILSLFLLLFMVSFVGIIDVEAVSSEIKKISGNRYEFTWEGIDDFSNKNYAYILEYKNASMQNFSGLSGLKIDASNGSVEFTPNIQTGEIIFSIIKDDGSNAVITSKSITIGTTTTKAPTTTTTTTVATTTEAPKSNNANLKTLTIKGNDGSDVVLSPSFDPSVYEYSATVLSTVKTVQIDATMEDSKANMVISNNASEELIAGENNKITITVTAEDGTKKAYTLNIKREALTSDATLKELTIEEVPSFKLEENEFTYTIKVEKNVKSLTIDYVLSEENSEANIEGNEDLKDGSKVKITVTAEDGTKKVYILNVSKETEVTKAVVADIPAEKNPLIIMALSIVAFGLIGGIIYVIKK